MLDEGRPPGVLIDGTDNFETRLLLNDLAVKHGARRLVFASSGVCSTATFMSRPMNSRQELSRKSGEFK